MSDLKIIHEEQYFGLYSDIIPDPETTFEELYDTLTNVCTRGKWKMFGKEVNEPKRSIIITTPETLQFRQEQDEEGDGLNIDPHPLYVFGDNSSDRLSDPSDLSIVKDLVDSVYASLRSLPDDETLLDYHYVLVNIYDNGKDGIGWHADEEAADGSIVSISLGQSRFFGFREKKKKNNGGKLVKLLLFQSEEDNSNASETTPSSRVEEKVARGWQQSPFTTKFQLFPGDVVWMKDGCQQQYKHTLYKSNSKKVECGPRINITCRRYPEFD